MDLEERRLLMNLLLAITSLSLAKVAMENNYGDYFVIK
jgi:hypothetical protein